MSLPFRLSLILLAILAGLLLAWGMVRASPDMQALRALPAPTHLPDDPAVESPDISFIDSPTAACVQIVGTANCLISWSYLYADAASNYMITMTVAIDDRVRARYAGFFQNSMYVPAEMLDFRVTCGAPGSGGIPNVGLSHSYTIRARDSNGLGSANYGTVTCPADLLERVFIPFLHK